MIERTKLGTFVKGKSSWNKGIKHTEEHKTKLKENHIGFAGKKHSERSRRKLSESRIGNKSYCWKGGITPDNMRVRNSIDYRLWREAVFARDSWTCQKSNQCMDDLVAHHMQSFSQAPELRFAIDNGITLSKKSHIEFHKKYGRTNNTKEQMIEFINERNL